MGSNRRLRPAPSVMGFHYSSACNFVVAYDTCTSSQAGWYEASGGASHKGVKGLHRHRWKEGRLTFVSATSGLIR